MNTNDETVQPTLGTRNVAQRVLMLKPTNFDTNYETLLDNKFMNEKTEGVDIKAQAIQEFDNFVNNLRAKNVEVVVFNQYKEEAVDSVFPNNWFSTHKSDNFPDGLLIIYPMKSPIRRLERNPEIISEFRSKYYANFEDISSLENEGEILESTGSLIFDNLNHKIYCNLSQRATLPALNKMLEVLNKYSKTPYRLITFKSYDAKGSDIYHTNVMMSILQKHVVICLDMIQDPNERKIVEEEVAEGRTVIKVSFEEMNKFCCNIINIRGDSQDAKSIVVMSKTAYDNFNAETKAILESEYDLCVNDISTIEFIGGGSARCMLAELY